MRRLQFRKLFAGEYVSPPTIFIKAFSTKNDISINIVLQVAHPNKIAVGGHSYGAFMTANLLAHAPHLFCCGIARSGAYNRTLTPFGFQVVLYIRLVVGTDIVAAAEFIRHRFCSFQNLCFTYFE